MGANKLLIVGAGGQGRVVADIAARMNWWQKIAFLEDDETIKVAMGSAVIDKTTNVAKYTRDYEIVVAIGNNQTRESLFGQLEVSGAVLPTLIHPSAVIGGQVELGTGSVVMAGAVINCGSKIGKGCIVNTGATIDHDNTIADYVHISPGVHVAGTVTIGKGSWLGIGSVVSNNLNIVAGCLVGAGAVVVNDLTEAGTYVGVPARRI